MTIESDLPVCIHAGMPKTGTTTLQYGVFEGVEECASIGKPFGKTDRGKAWRGYLRRLCSQASWSAADEEAVASGLADMLAEKPPDFWSNRKSAVLSFEALSNTKGSVGPAEKAARLVGVLRRTGFSGDIHYWLTTREPINFIESQYLNHVRTYKRIPSMATWVGERYERWDLFDYSELRDAIAALDGISGVTFVPMDGLFRFDRPVLDAVCEALSLQPESARRFRELLTGAPRKKARPDELLFLCGRLRFELAERGIPLQWAVSLLEFAASRSGRGRSQSGQPGDSKKTLAAIRRDLTGYREDGLRASATSERSDR